MRLARLEQKVALALEGLSAGLEGIRYPGCKNDDVGVLLKCRKRLRHHAASHDHVLSRSEDGSMANERARRMLEAAREVEKIRRGALHAGKPCGLAVAVSKLPYVRTIDALLDFRGELDAVLMEAAVVHIKKHAL